MQSARGIVPLFHQQPVKNTKESLSMSGWIKTNRSSHLYSPSFSPAVNIHADRGYKVRAHEFLTVGHRLISFITLNKYPPDSSSLLASKVDK